VAAGVSFFFNESIDALIIIAIVLLSSLLGFWQEKRAADAVQTLLSIVKMDATVLRDGQQTSVPVEEVVPGDICRLKAGDIIPGDAAILESKDLFVDEAALTGESYPAEKETGIIGRETPLMRRTNSLFMGTHVISGNALALVEHRHDDRELRHDNDLGPAVGRPSAGGSMMNCRLTPGNDESKGSGRSSATGAVSRSNGQRAHSAASRSAPPQLDPCPAVHP